MSLFVTNSDSEDDSEPPLKVPRIVPEDISDTDEWEEIPLNLERENFEITIDNSTNDDSRREKIRHMVREKQTRTSVHYLSMVTYMHLACTRNKWLSDKKVLKKLKKLLPQAFLKQVKKFKRDIELSNPNRDEKLTPPIDLDPQFIYILKYLIKWFRLNFKICSNGIRVLGYLPKEQDPLSYFPNNSAKMSNVDDFLQTIKYFKHNRDTAAMIFTGLVRSIGLESRLVFSLPLLSVSHKTKLQPIIDPQKLSVNKDNDLLYPYFWTEVVNPVDPHELIILESVCFHNEEDRLTRLFRHRLSPITKEKLQHFYTPIFCPIPSQFNQMTMHYVISLDSKGLILDVTLRYMVDIAYRWFNKLDLRTDLGRAALLFQSLILYFNKHIQYGPHENRELDVLRELAIVNYTIPNNFTAMKRNANVITKSTLRYNEIIEPGTPPIKKIILDKHKTRVYFKNSVVVGKSENQWKFLGRSVLELEKNNPIKMTNALTPRTIYKKRIFVSNVMNNTPELNETKLYSFSQTEPYVTLSVVTDIFGHRVLPRNKYGNIEIFRPSMVPKSTVWITLPGIEQILLDYKSKRLNTPFTEPIEYISVVVGFSFNGKNAIPVKNGVIVLDTLLVIARKVWFYGMEKIKRIRVQASFRGWITLLQSLRIKDRLIKEYGNEDD